MIKMAPVENFIEYYYDEIYKHPDSPWTNAELKKAEVWFKDAGHYIDYHETQSYFKMTSPKRTEFVREIGL